MIRPADFHAKYVEARWALDALDALYLPDDYVVVDRRTEDEKNGASFTWTDTVGRRIIVETRSGDG